ncbi:hypothetical protein [Nocardioides acrostichi]|uniref:Leucine rich repeat variant n=1 Tax=Nocardioides acrostichi TaxID=2784339 RepID=A0A930V5C3_9ACTN|nr:hypothetical protein [Nocardioides acrostichi]MBF4164025.1 hypothetical protein [Nocardioides acrostichi]
MIESADEFVRLRTSAAPEDYRRAAHDAAPVRIWLEVIDRYPHMRPWVAHNKTVPIEILTVLASDSEAEVRCAVADKRKLTVGLFRQLAADPDEGVRTRVAYNRKAPVELLETLALDPAVLVHEAARSSLARRPSDS